MSSDESDLTPESIKLDALGIVHNLLPEKSKEKYLKAYNDFDKWQTAKVQSLCLNQCFWSISSIYHPQRSQACFTYPRTAQSASAGIPATIYLNFGIGSTQFHVRIASLYLLESKNSGQQKLVKFNKMICECANRHQSEDMHQLRTQSQVSRRKRIGHNNFESTNLEEPVTKKIKVDEVLPNNITTNDYFNEEFYDSSGLRKCLHGIVYQQKLLMLFLRRALKNKYNFQLATEMDAAAKFDDIVFRYKNENKETLIRFLQAKHIQNEESFNITLNDLLSRKDGRFYLGKYFLSYLKIKSDPRFLRANDTFEDFIICTNIELGNDLEKYCQTVDYSNDKILNQGRFSKLKRENFYGHERDQLNEVLENCSDLKRLSKILANHLVKKKILDFHDPLLASYHQALGIKVINTEKAEKAKEGKKTKFYAKFHEHFLDINLTEETSITFRNAFKEAYEYECLHKGVKQSIDEFLDDMRKKKFQISKKFSKAPVHYNLIDLKEFAEQFSDAMINASSGDKLVTIKRSNNTINSNIDKLAWHVLVKKGKNDTNKFRFSSKFIMGQNLPGDLGKFRKCLKNALEDKGKVINDNYTFHITNFTSFEEETYVKTSLPHDVITEVDINDFFKHFVIASNQPNEISLKGIIIEEMGQEKDFNLIDNEFLANMFYIFVFDWMKDKRGMFLNHTQGELFFEKAISVIGSLKLNMCNVLSNIKMENWMFKEDNDIYIKMRSFFQNPTEGCEQILHVNTKNTFLTKIKIYQVLLEMKIKHFLDLSLDTLWLLESTKSKIKPMTCYSKKKDYFIIEVCQKISENKKQVIVEKLFQVLKEKPQKRIIFIILDKYNDKFTFNENCIKLEDSLNFLDLIEKSQEKLMEEGIVIFQGKDTSLKNIVDENMKSLIKDDVLCSLISQKKIKIGEAPKDIKYNNVEPYYISRTWSRNTKLKEDFQNNPTFVVLRDQDMDPHLLLPDSRDIILITDTESNFQKLCDKNWYNNIHWIRNKGNSFIWQQSRGSVSKLRDYVDIICEDRNENPKPEIITDLNDRVVIITAEPGMGKSITLSHLAVNSIKQMNNNLLWIIKINLVDNSEFLANINDNEIDSVKAKKFLLEAMNFELFKVKGNKTTNDELIDIHMNGKISPKPGNLVMAKEWLEVEVFNYFYELGKLAILFDGFDEITPNYKYKVITLLEFFKNSKIEKLWVTTRPYAIQNELENKLNTFSYKIDPLLETEQEELLMRIWEIKLRINKIDCNLFSKFVKCLREQVVQAIDNSLIKTLIGTTTAQMTYSNNYSPGIEKYQERFLGVPLHVRMIARVYKKVFKDYYDKNDMSKRALKVGTFSEKITFEDMYRKFFDIKFDRIYLGKKEKAPEFNKADPKFLMITVRERRLEITKHRNWALFELFNEDQLQKLLNEREIEEVRHSMKHIREGKNKIGIVHRVIDNKPRFIHRTFAEYFVADFLANKLKQTHKEDEQYKSALNFLYENFVQLAVHNSLLLIFFNYKIVDSSVIHSTVLSGNWQEIDKIAKSAINDKDSCGRTPLHLAAYNSDLKVVTLLLKRGAKALKKDKLFKWNCLHYAVSKERMDIVNHLLLRLKGSKKLKKIVNALDIYERSCISLAAQGDMTFFFSVFCRTLRQWKIDFNINVKDVSGKTPLHLLVSHGSGESLNHLLSLGADPNISDGSGRTPLHDFVKCRGNDDILLFKLLISHGAKLTKKDKREKRTALQMALESQNLSLSSLFIRKLLLDKRKKKVIKVIREMNNRDFCVKLLQSSMAVAKLLLDDEVIDVNEKDADGKTALHYAVQQNEEGIIDFLLSKGANPNIQDVNLKRPLQASSLSNTATILSLLKSGAFFDDIDGNDGSILMEIEKLFDNVQSNNVNAVETILVNLNNITGTILNSKTIRNDNQTPIHYAVGNGNLEMTRVLLYHGAFYNVPDKKQNTPLMVCRQYEKITRLIKRTEDLFDAVAIGDVTRVNKCIKESEEGAYIINAADFDRQGMQPIHLAVYRGQTKVLKTLLAKKVMTNGTTTKKANVLHLAAQNKNVNILYLLLSKLEFGIIKELINCRDVNGDAPLHIAVRKGNKEQAVQLLENGAEVDIRTLCDQLTPLHIAAKSGKADLVNCLLEHKAEVLKCFFGSSPFDIAMQHNHVNVAVLIYKMRPNCISTL